MHKNVIQPRRSLSGNGKRGLAWRLLAVGLVAFALRAGYTVQFSRGPGELIADANHYHEFAMNLVQRGEYMDAQGDRLSRMPGYPVFMAGIFLAFGPSLLAVQMAQCFLSALACVCLYAAARRLYGEKFGLGAGLAATVYFGMIDPCVLILSDSLTTSFLAGFFWAWFCLKGPVPRVVVGVFLLGLACITRPDFIVFGGAACLLLTRIERGFKPRHSVMWFAVFLLLWAPWLVRNYRIFGRVIPISTQGAWSRYMGLALPLMEFGDIEEIITIPNEVDEIEENAIFRRELWALLKNVPPAKILRAYAFNIAAVFYPFLPEYDWTYMFLLPFWLWSATLIRGRPEARLMWLMIGLYCLIHVVAGGPVSRYRQTLSGAFILLAAGGAQDLHRRFGPRLWRWSGVYAGANIVVWLFAPQFRSVALRMRDSFF